MKITFTTDQLIAGVCLVLTVMQIINLYITLKAKAQDPDKKRDEEIANLRAENEKLKGEVGKYRSEVGELRCQVELSWTKVDKVRGTMLDSTRVLMQAVQALITHEVDGNNTKGLIQSSEDIKNFVWEHFGDGNKKAES